MRKLLLCFSMIACWVTSYAQKPNIAPQATASASTCNTGACSTLNDLNYGSCGTQQMWIPTSTPPTSTVGTDYIEWNWSIPQSFDEMTIHHGQSTGRSLTGFLMQTWNGTAWVDGETFTNLPQQCINTISFQRVTASRMRITKFEMTAAGQQSNPNFREIEIWQASVANNDAGVTLVDSAQAACPGSYPVTATVQNYGLNRIDSVMVNWSVDGVGQTPVWHTSLLDTIGGTLPSSAVVTLGNYTFTSNTNYTVKVWTSMPNSSADTTNYNDTLSSVVRLAAPTGFMAGNVQPTSAVLSWNTLGASNFRVTYGTAGFNPQTGGSTVTASGSSTSLTTLTPNTPYEAYLVADCGSGVYSDTTGPISFRTPCTITTAPFNESFDDPVSWISRNTIDPCWGASPSPGTTWSWEPKSGAPSSGNGPLQDLTGGNYMYCEASISGSFADAELISPAIDVSGLTTPGLYFFQHRYSGGTIADMSVEVSNDFGTTWNTVYTITGDVQTSNSDAWSLEFVNLVAYTGDTIMVKFIQKFNGCCGDAAIDSVVVDEAPTCPWPTGAGVVTTTDSSAVISWNDPTGSAWEVIWGPPGFTQASPGAGTRNTTHNPDTIPGLQSNTEYEYYVRTDCGPNGNSIWIGPIGFRTECSALTAPYFNNFDSDPTGNPPLCWSDYRVGTSSSFSQANVLSSTVAYSPGNILYFYNYTPASAQDTTMAIMPAFSDLPAGDKQLRFKAYSTSTTNPYIIVGTMAASGIGSSFTPMDTVYLTGSYQEFVVPLTVANGYNGTDVYPALMHGKSAIAQVIYIDDFYYEVIPACAPPTSLSLGVSGVSPTTATIYWGSGGSGNETHWEVGGVGFTPGTNTYISTDSVAGNVDTTVAGGLSPQTTYEFYIRDSCGVDGFSPWVGPFSFTTACNILTAPLSEDFDGSTWVASGSNSGNSIDACWTTIPDVSNGSEPFKWIPRSTGPTSGNGPLNDKTGGNYLYVEASSSSANDLAYLYSPIVDVSALTVPALYFAQHRYSGATIADMDIEVTNDFGLTWTNVYNVTGDIQTSSSAAWEDYIIPLGAFVGDTIQIRFVQTGNGCCGDAAIDDVEIKEAPTCPDVINLDATGILDTAATLSWVGNPATNSYEVWFGPLGFFQGTATMGGAKSIVSTSSLLVDSISQRTCYEFLVRGICAPGDTGNWVGPFSFCTPCSPVVAPYTENFDALSTGLAGDLGNCWVGSGTTSTYSWRTNSGATGSASTGPNGDATTGSGIYLYTEASSGTVGDIATMTSPLIDVSALSNPEMRFSYHMFGANIDTLFVDIYDGTQWNDGVFKLDEQQQSSSTEAWRDTLVDISSFATSGLVQVRFRLRSRGCCPGDAAIDDFEVSNPITCPSPSNLVVSSVSGGNATITWGGNSSAQSYIVEYGQGGFTPGTGTTATVTGTSYGITGLPLNNIAYQAYVRAYCGGTDSSFWTGPVTILTDPNLCTENFEAYNTGVIDGQSTLFVGWNGDGGDGEVTTAQSSSGSQSLHIYTTGPNAFSDIVTNMDTSFTSGIHSLKFNMFIPSTYGGYYNILHSYTGPTNVWAIEVYIDANGTASVEMGTNATGTIGTYNTTPNTWNTIEHIIDLDIDTAWIMVNGVNTNLGWQFSLGSTNMGDRFNAVNFYSAANAGQLPNYYVDDFCVQPYVPVACPAPTTLNVSGTNIGCDSAEVSWVSQSVGNSTILEYGPTGFTPGTGTLVPFVSSPYVISGLSPNTGYDFYVADTCGSSDTSAVSGPFTFNTPTGPVPQASFTYTSTYTATSQDVSFDASASVNADTLKWDFGNGSTATGATASTSYPLPNTSYSVTLTAITSCGLSHDTTIVINTNIGLEDLGFSGTFKLYPNPNSGVFKVQLSLDEAIDSRLVITDVSGKELLSEEIQSKDGYFEHTIDVKYLPKGVYFVKLETSNGKVLRRFVKE